MAKLSERLRSRPLVHRFMMGVAAGTLAVGIGASVLPAFSQNDTVHLAQNLSEPRAAVSAPQGQTPPSFADMIERVKPAVVSVKVRSIANVSASGDDVDMDIPGMSPNDPVERFFRQFREQQQQQRGGRPQRRQVMSQGSGFFISHDGLIVTNNHVVEGARDVDVVLDNGKTLAAKVIGTDPKTDIALLKVKEGGSYPYVSFADKPPRVGEWAIAVGNPFGLGGTVTSGIVSARGRDIGAGPYDDFLQIDAPVNRGNSGGPTFDAQGRVVGVNTAIYSPSGGSVGIAFAVPSETVQKVVAALEKGGTIQRGFIGVESQNVTADIADSIGMKGTDGALVIAARRDGPAGKAGVRTGDVITAVNGETVRDPRDLARKIGMAQPGSKVDLKLWRDGKEAAVSFDIAKRPASADAGDRQVQPDRG